MFSAKPLSVILPVIFLVLSAFFIFFASRERLLVENTEVPLSSPRLAGAAVSVPAAPEVILLAVGDIMLSRGVQYKINTEGGGDFLFPFLKIAKTLQAADILFGNLEGPISDKGEKVGSIYSFRAKPEVIAGLVFAGFDVLSLANNHMFDYQRTALEETMRLLSEKDVGIDYVGAGSNQEEAFSVKVREVRGTRIGFLAYTDLGPGNWRAGEQRPGIAWIDGDIEAIKQDVAIAKDVVDILAVSLHSGEEYSPNPTPFQVSFAEACIDSGADLVLEHHSHVTQRVEQYKDGWIAYGLGNFVFDQGFSEATMRGLMLKATIKKDVIQEVSLINITINDSFQPGLLSGTVDN